MYLRVFVLSGLFEKIPNKAAVSMHCCDFLFKSQNNTSVHVGCLLSLIQFISVFNILIL